MIVNYKNLAKHIDPTLDKIEPGPSIFDDIVDGKLDPCVAQITFGDDCIRIHVCQSGQFRVGSAKSAMSRAVIRAIARADRFISLCGLTGK